MIERLIYMYISIERNDYEISKKNDFSFFM